MCPSANTDASQVCTQFMFIVQLTHKAPFTHKAVNRLPAPMAETSEKAEG
jgi:hypothetical protein